MGELVPVKLLGSLCGKVVEGEDSTSPITMLML
eukprot:COSAG02_NODE_296_length_25401_cov_7.672437_4_plen_33_part_00